MNRAREFFTGVGFVFRGFGFWSKRPGLAALGAVPPLIVGVLMLVLLAAVISQLPAFVTWATPFAETWAPVWRNIVRFSLGALIVVGSGVLFVLTFSAISLAVGSPVYDRISKAVDDELGMPGPRHELSFWRGVSKTITDALLILIVAIPLAIAVFAVGLLPVVGSFLGLVLGAIVGGRALAIDLTGTPMDARGFTLGQRRKKLRASWPRTMGFGVACYLLFLIPGVAVLAMPAATAGATLLTRSLFEERLR